MEHFLLYIMVSSLVTLISVVFAYKPEEDQLSLADFNKTHNNGEKIDTNPVYTDQPVKSNTKAFMPSKALKRMRRA